MVAMRESGRIHERRETKSPVPTYTTTIKPMTELRSDAAFQSAAHRNERTSAAWEVRESVRAVMNRPDLTAISQPRSVMLQVIAIAITGARRLAKGKATRVMVQCDEPVSEVQRVPRSKIVWKKSTHWSSKRTPLTHAT